MVSKEEYEKYKKEAEELRAKQKQLANDYVMLLVEYTHIKEKAARNVARLNTCEAFMRLYEEQKGE